jgi:ribulose 1,5-bisphosphate synthetase/thiazole synthase
VAKTCGSGLGKGKFGRIYEEIVVMHDGQTLLEDFEIEVYGSGNKDVIQVDKTAGR